MIVNNTCVLKYIVWISLIKFNICLKQRNRSQAPYKSKPAVTNICTYIQAYGRRATGQIASKPFVTKCGHHGLNHSARGLNDIFNRSFIFRYITPSQLIAWKITPGLLRSPLRATHLETLFISASLSRWKWQASELRQVYQPVRGWFVVTYQHLTLVGPRNFLTRNRDPKEIRYEGNRDDPDNLASFHQLKIWFLEESETVSVGRFSKQRGQRLRDN